MEHLTDSSGSPRCGMPGNAADDEESTNRESVASRHTPDDEYSHVREEDSNPHCDAPTADSTEASMPRFSIEILDFAPGWALSTEETKILVVVAVEGDQPITDSQLYLVCGTSTEPVEVVQTGAYRCIISPQDPGFVSLYLTIDRIHQISEALSFEIRDPASSHAPDSPGDREAEIVEFQFQWRLVHLLFTRSSSTLRFFHSEDSGAASEETGDLSSTPELTLPQARIKLLEMIFENKLEEWLLEKAASGGNGLLERDENGHGAIHMCAVLGYSWSPRLFACCGLSLDFRDKCGWTALHFAASHGKEEMVESLLLAGARAHLVTDPTPYNHRGLTAIELAEGNLKCRPDLVSYISTFASPGRSADAGELAGKLWWRFFVGTVGFVDKVMVRWKRRERGGLCRLEALLGGGDDEGCGQQALCCVVGSCKKRRL